MIDSTKRTIVTWTRITPENKEYLVNLAKIHGLSQTCIINLALHHFFNNSGMIMDEYFYDMKRIKGDEYNEQD